MRRVTTLASAVGLLVSACASAPLPLRPGDPRLDAHPAVVLLPAQPEFDGYSDALAESPHPFLCGEGGAREAAWAVCLVRSAGVVVLVTFGDGGRPPSLTAEVDFGDAMYGVPLDIPFGFVHEPGEVTVRIKSGDQVVGELGGELG